MADEPNPAPATGGTPAPKAPDPAAKPAVEKPAQGALPLAKGEEAPKGDDAAALKAQLEAARAEAERGRAAQAELDRIKAERDEAERKRLEEQGEWQKIAEQNAQKASALQKRVLTERIRSTAMSEGLIDESLVDMIKADESFLVNGEPDQQKIARAVADFKASKSHFFKAPPGPSTGAGGAPPPAPEKPGSKFDFSSVGAENQGGKTQNTRAFGEANALFERAKRELRR